MRIGTAAVAMTAVLVAAAGCVAQGRGKPIQDYPEARDYGYCVIGKARAYAAQKGALIDLAFAAVSACRTQRNQMEHTIGADYPPTFVNEFMRRNDRTMLEIAAEAIAEARR